MKQLKLLYPIAFGAIVLLSSCNSKKEKGTDKEAFRFNEEQERSNFEVTKSFIYSFPAPGEILTRIAEADLSYREDLMNPSSSSMNYITTKDKALNLGIYLTDMAYASMFSRSSVAVDYLEVVQSLSSEISISTSTFESLIERAKLNIGNKDSLLLIANEVFFQMIDFLETSGKENTIALVSAGAYVESMYIAFQNVEEFSADNAIINQIAELKFPLQNLLDHAETVSEDPNVQSIIKYIRELNSTFSELEVAASSGEVKKEEPGVISLIGGNKDEMDEDTFNSLKGKVVEVRDFIITF